MNRLQRRRAATRVASQPSSVIVHIGTLRLVGFSPLFGRRVGAAFEHNLRRSLQDAAILPERAPSRQDAARTMLVGPHDSPETTGCKLASTVLTSLAP